MIKTADFPHPATCDVCSCENENVIVDGATRSGPWALMCAPCAVKEGVGLGVGKGQAYLWTAGAWTQTNPS